MAGNGGPLAANSHRHSSGPQHAPIMTPDDRVSTGTLKLVAMFLGSWRQMNQIVVAALADLASGRPLNERSNGIDEM